MEIGCKGSTAYRRAIGADGKPLKKTALNALVTRGLHRLPADALQPLRVPLLAPLHDPELISIGIGEVNLPAWSVVRVPYLRDLDALLRQSFAKGGQVSGVYV